MDYSFGRAAVVLIIMAFAILFACCAAKTLNDPESAKINPMWAFATEVLFTVLFALCAAGVAGMSDRYWRPEDHGRSED